MIIKKYPMNLKTRMPLMDLTVSVEWQRLEPECCGLRKEENKRNWKE